MRVEIKIESVRANRRDGECGCDALRLPCVDHDNLGGISNVHVKCLRVRLEYRPSGPARHRDFGPHSPGIDVDDGQCVQARSGWVTNIGNDDLATDMIVGEAIRSDMRPLTPAAPDQVERCRSCSRPGWS